jgi:hypothetical protein
MRGYYIQVARVVVIFSAVGAHNEFASSSLKLNTGSLLVLMPT